MTQSAINYTPGHLYPIALLDPDWLLYQPGTLPDGDLAVIGQLPQSGLLLVPAQTLDLRCDCESRGASTSSLGSDRAVGE